jgi:putative ABC transport system ATP-binding protein
MENKNSIVNIVDVKKIYHMGEVEVKALDGVNLKVHEGEFLSIVGPSGSGKSTLLNMIGALDRPSEGTVMIKGIDISDLNDEKLANLRNKEIGFVFQFFNLIHRMTAKKNVELPMNFAGVNPEKRRSRAIELLKRVGLTPRHDHKPPELTGGEQQRVAIARALVNNPSIVLCDEPTGNVDTKTGEEIMGILRKLNVEQEKTFIIVTHDPKVYNLTDRIAYMQDGRIIKEEIMS